MNVASSSISKNDDNGTHVNESWKLCYQNQWTLLRMRLGMYPNEGRSIESTLTKRSILHQVVISAASSETSRFRVAVDDDDETDDDEDDDEDDDNETDFVSSSSSDSDETDVVQQHQRQPQQQSENIRHDFEIIDNADDNSDSSSIIRAQDYFNNPAPLPPPLIADGPPPAQQRRAAAIRRPVADDDDDDNRIPTRTTFVTPLTLRSVYFSCPQAMLLQDAIHGYTPLHYAIARSSATNNLQSDDDNDDSSLELICTLLDLCQRKCSVESDCPYKQCNDDDNNNSSSSTNTASNTNSNRCWFEEDDDDNDQSDDDDDDGQQQRVETTTTVTATSSDRNNENDDDNEQRVLLLQDHLGDTPLHTACRYNCQRSILIALMEACPSALVKYNTDGMTPLRLLWSTLLREQDTINTSSSSVAAASSSSMRSSATSLEDIIINQIHSYKDLYNYPLLKDIWEKSLIFLHMLTTWDIISEETLFGLSQEAAEDSNDQQQQDQPPELCFQILHSIASMDCDGLLMELALKFYPQEYYDLDDAGQSVLDIAIAQSIQNQHRSNSVVEVLMKHDKDGKLYKICETNCCQSRPPLHRAILAGKSWYNGGVEALCDQDVTSSSSSTILSVNNISVREPDVSTGLYPFMMAATVTHDMSKGGEPLKDCMVVTTIMELLKRAPELVMPCSSQKKVSSSKSDVQTMLAAEEETPENTEASALHNNTTSLSLVPSSMNGINSNNAHKTNGDISKISILNHHSSELRTNERMPSAIGNSTISSNRKRKRLYDPPASVKDRKISMTFDDQRPLIGVEPDEYGMLPLTLEEQQKEDETRQTNNNGYFSSLTRLSYDYLNSFQEETNDEEDDDEDLNLFFQRE